MFSRLAFLRFLVLPAGAINGPRIVLNGITGEITLFDVNNVLVGRWRPAGLDVINPSGASLSLIPSGSNAVLFMKPPNSGLHTYNSASLFADTIGAHDQPMIGYVSPSIVGGGNTAARIDMYGSDTAVALPPGINIAPNAGGGVGGVTNVLSDLVATGDLTGVDVNAAGDVLAAGTVDGADDVSWAGVSLPRGFIGFQGSSGASAAFTTTATVRTLPGTVLNYTNNDPTLTRKIKVNVSVRFNMAAGVNGLYRPYVTDGGSTALSFGDEQTMNTVVGGSGQTGASDMFIFDVAPAASLTVGAGGLRVTNGSATDAMASGNIIVEDIGGF